MKRILFTMLLCFCALQYGFSQGPKWVTKAKKSVFSIMTFDKDHNLLKTGNGFFISPTGVGVSDFDLFKGAYRAVVINTDGKEIPVECILGADDTYDVVKFRVDLSLVKKVDYIDLNTSNISIGDEVFVLPYSVEKDRACTPGKVKKVDVIRDNHKYYTLDLRTSTNLVSCPVLNASGMAVGLLQKSFDNSDSMTSHAVDANFVAGLQISALSFDDVSLKDIYIKKGLPEQEDQSLVYLMMVSSKLPLKEMGVLYSDFIKQFPNSSEGYLKRAQYFLNIAEKSDDVLFAENDLKKALEVSPTKDAILFSIARLILNNQGLEVLNDLPNWQVETALERIDEAIRIKDEAIYTQLRAEALTLLGRFDEALDCYSVVNKSEIASPLSFYNTALVEKAKGSSSDVVLVLLDSCVNRLEKPYNFSASPYLFERAQVLTSIGKHRDALKDLDEYYYSVNGQVNSAFFYFREQVAVQAKLFQQALDDIELAIQLDPNEPIYLAEKASINLRVGRYEVALETVNNLIALDPNYAEAYRLQGVAYMQLKDNRACASFKKAKELGDIVVEQLIDKHCK
ncbi:Tetratricopeptide TPR_1 repeat-containing protein [Bacteroides coprosuis DSM 18011]|uniref:Tetratricopeptide TPR_1 repeat-containing protein n=1 Tax=Bacteroides coprosuis DSM 18011 TaxID=679937 RepID=F3ZUM2_9BACE|nr:serine protease [Bacteroides coprosuis]EGJ71187.1 Tetratricopeptide TPR_1 repeat-containing protein [Bacteroides coprosuis DSM 18011]